MFGSRPMATNSVEPMPKPPRASASSAKRIRAGDNVVGPSRGGSPVDSRTESNRFDSGARRARRHPTARTLSRRRSPPRVARPSPSSSPAYPGRMSAFSTSETREPYSPTASVARRTTSKTSSHSPSIVGEHRGRSGSGRPDSRTIRTAAATASCTDPSARPVPLGATENATSMSTPTLEVLFGAVRSGATPRSDARASPRRPACQTARIPHTSSATSSPALTVTSSTKAGCAASSHPYRYG